NSFEDICKFQKILDEEIGKVRNNGFVPEERTVDKIKISAIAECVEFNEETLETHKTWKQKEFKKESMLEELTDIVFFISQLVNSRHRNWLEVGKGDYFLRATEELFKPEKYDCEKHSLNVYLTNLIVTLSIGSTYEVIERYAMLVNASRFTKEDIFKEYERKWKINMTRINKDWTL
ncbi:MAG: dUTP diphosphatase, partial [Clostridia bacterium]